jgi:hypothetical protein
LHIPAPELPNEVNIMIDASLVLCKTLLHYSSSFYPFAAVCIDGDVQCVFIDETKEYEQGVIEQLEDTILHHTVNVSKSNSLIAYSAYMETPTSARQDVLVFEVALYNGSVNQILYPVCYSEAGVEIGTPLLHQNL